MTQPQQFHKQFEPVLTQNMAQPKSEPSVPTVPRPDQHYQTGPSSVAVSVDVPNARIQGRMPVAQQQMIIKAENVSSANMSTVAGNVKPGKCFNFKIFHINFILFGSDGRD